MISWERINQEELTCFFMRPDGKGCKFKITSLIQKKKAYLSNTCYISITVISTGDTKMNSTCYLRIYDKMIKWNCFNHSFSWKYISIHTTFQSKVQDHHTGLATRKIIYTIHNIHQTEDTPVVFCTIGETFNLFIFNWRIIALQYYVWVEENF